MLKQFRILLFLCFTFVFAACGGGGDDGPDIDGSLSVNPSTLQFSADQNGAAPSSQYISFSSSNPNAYFVYAGYPAGSTPPSWMDMQFSGSNQVRVFMTTTNLTPGTYTATIRILTSDINDTLLDYKDIAVSYTVEARLASNVSSIVTDYVLGSDVEPSNRVLQVYGSGVQWQAQVDQPWINLSATTGTAPSSVTVSFDITGLALGTYNANITFTNLNDLSDNFTVPVTLNVVLPSISLNATNVVLGGDDGEDYSAITITMSLNTGTNSYPWNMTLDSGSGMSWLQSTLTSGSVDASGVSFNLDADRAGLSGGTYDGTATIEVDVNGDLIAATINVSLNIAEHRIGVIDNGIALTSTPSISILTKSLTVSDSKGLTTTPWTASSDQSWLSVTPSGMAGSNLVLTADPAGLALDTIHYATVTLDSTETSVSSTDEVRVGFWVSNTDPAARNNVAIRYSEIASDPIRPYVYAHQAGTDIDVYNVYTASLVTTIPNVGVQLGDMEASSDGSTLFVVDNSNRVVIPLDLDSFTSSTGWTTNSISSVLRISYARTNGFGLVYSSHGRAYDFSGGNEYVSPGGAVITTSLDGTTLCGINTGLSPYTVGCSRLSFSLLNGGVLSAISLGNGPFGIGSNGKDVALSHDGSTLYAASGAPYAFAEYSTATMSYVGPLTANAYPNSVEMGSNGLLYGGSFTWYGPLDVWVYDSAGVSLGSYYFSGYAESLYDRQLVVSGDGKRIVGATTDPNLVFVTGP